MNSFQDLNAYSAASTIEFTDLRPSNVLFDLSTVPTPAPVNIYEGENHNVPTPINITDIINYQACTIIYKVDVSGFPAGTTVEWPSYPGYMTATNASGVYSITGFKTPTDWTTVKTPVVNIPDDISGTYIYPVSIVYFNGTVETTKSWNVTANIIAVDEMSAATVFDFLASTTSIVTGTPLIIDSNVAKTYTLTITPSRTASVTTLSSSGTGGTSSFNGTTKVLTLVGTKAQVNSHLAAISLVTTSSTNDFTLTYLLTNNLNAVTDTQTQTLRCLDLLYLTNTRSPVIYYNEDTVKNVQGGPLITDSAYDGSGAYTMTVTPSTTAAISTMSATASAQAKTITNTGAVKIKTAISKFGGASAYFPGLGTDLITVTNSPAFNFSNNDFSIEFWIYPSYGFPSSGIMNKVGTSVFGAHLGWTISMQDYKVEFWRGLPTPTNYSPLVAVAKTGQSSTLSSNSWSHIAFTCENGTFRTFTNGVLTQTVTNIGQIAQSDSYLQIGKGYYGDDGNGNNGASWRDTWQKLGSTTEYTNGMFVGYLDEIRISKIARYTATFTPAATAFTGDNYQSLLIHANGANDSTAFTDDTAGQSVAGTASFNGSTKVLTLSGTRDAVNNLVDFISLTPATDYRTNFALSYTVTTPRSSTATKTQQVLIGVADVDITNMNSTRSYVANNPNYIFATNTPVIGDTDQTNPSYTVSVSCSTVLGSFATDRNTTLPAYTNMSFTGTKAECNAWFATVIFYPKKDVTASGLITYTQSKNGTQQINQQFSIIGSAGTYPDEGFVAGPTTVGIVSWTPTKEQVYYVGVIQILLVGAGGGGGFGGGGGGQFKLINNVTITNTTYIGNVGSGGTAAYFDAASQTYISSTQGGGTSLQGGYNALGGLGGSKFDQNNANGVFGGGNSYAANSSSTTNTGKAGFGSDYTLYVGGAGGGTGGSSVNWPGGSAPASAGGNGYTYEDITYGVGGQGAKWANNTNTHTKGATSGTAGGGGGGAIGGTFKKTGTTTKYNLPLADNGQNGRIKIWVRRV